MGHLTKEALAHGSLMHKFRSRQRVREWARLQYNYDYNSCKNFESNKECIESHHRSCQPCRKAMFEKYMTFLWDNRN